MIILKEKENRMTYFTSWDINVFLCLISLGIPEDLVRGWVSRIRVENRKFCLERDRSYHCRRGVIFQKPGIPTWWRLSVYWKLLKEFKSKLRDIEPEDRYEYFEWAYENHYYTWSLEDLDWVKGFHPGRFFLMDHRRKEIMEEIRDLEDIGAWQEERFIRKQDHIDDLIKGRKNNWIRRRGRRTRMST